MTYYFHVPVEIDLDFYETTSVGDRQIIFRIQPKIEAWLEQNMQGKYHLFKTGSFINKVAIEDEKDAILYKLTFE